MNPLLDEKMLLICSAILPEIFQEVLEIDCIREAYGPTINEGVCFEDCFEFKFSGTASGAFYLGLDGYTKILLLPYLNRKIQIKKQNPKELLNEMLFKTLCNQLAEILLGEMIEFVNNFVIDSIVTKNHKLIPIEGSENRKYIIIFFLKDSQLKRYLGRLYLILAIKKEF